MHHKTYLETNILSWSLDGSFIDNSKFIQSGVVAVTFKFFKCFLLTPCDTHTQTHTNEEHFEAREDVAFFLLLSLSAKPHSSCSCHPFHLLYWRGSTSLFWGIYLTFGLEILDRETWALRFHPLLSVSFMFDLVIMCCVVQAPDL